MFFTKRWGACGVAIAATITAGIALPSASATNTDGGGTGAVFVPITPCRLFDTRADSVVGPRSTPLTAGESYTQAVAGTNGNCTIPTQATGVAMNVTAVNPTATSYLTLWPADASRPLASNLNWIVGAPPTPNKVDVRLSVDGKISVYNNGGFVDVVADVVGYYANHNHDDRYYTKDQIYNRAEVDAAVSAAIATRAPLPAGAHALIVPSTAFIGEANAENWNHDINFGTVGVSTAVSQCAMAPVSLPDGVTVLSVVGHLNDSSGALNGEIGLFRDTPGLTPVSNMAQKTTTGSSGDQTITDTTINSPVIANGTAAYSAYVCLSSNIFAYDVVINYTY